MLSHPSSAKTDGGRHLFNGGLLQIHNDVSDISNHTKANSQFYQNNQHILHHNIFNKQNGKHSQVSNDDKYHQKIVASANAPCDIHSQTPTPPSQLSTNTSGFGSGAPTSGSGSGGSGMSGSAVYYINESMSESSGDSLNNSNNGNTNSILGLQRLRDGKNQTGKVNSRGKQMKSSKSAHVITSCEVYAEVVDAAGASSPSHTTPTNHKRQSYHCGSGAMLNNTCHIGPSRVRKPGNLSVDELRNLNGNSGHELTTASSKDSNRIYINGGGNSSGFNSAGDGSTCSNGDTPPPLGRSTPNISSANGISQASTVATISNMNLEQLNDSQSKYSPIMHSFLSLCLPLSVLTEVVIYNVRKSR